MILKTTCIQCPVGCSLEIEKTGDEITVTGNRCVRGQIYGKEEITAPKRVVTSIVKAGNTIYSVKTNKSVPKDKIFDVLNELAKLNSTNENLQSGDVMIENVLNLGADIIVTGKNKII